MKQLIVFFLIVGLILPLGGCAWMNNNAESVQFYYQASDALHRDDGSVIVAEERDISGDSMDLEHLLRLYLMGPYDESLQCPFPRGLRITNIRTGPDTLILTMTDQLSTLTASQRSIAYSCLVLTCLDLTGMQTVILMLENEMITMDRSSVMLHDGGVRSPN